MIEDLRTLLASATIVGLFSHGNGLAPQIINYLERRL